MSALAEVIKSELKALANTDKIPDYQRFFKTKKGEYGEGDVFIGVNVPNQRKIAKIYYKEVTTNELSDLLHSPVHEHRLCALMMLVYKSQKEKNIAIRKAFFDFYINNTKYINNWDLVDTSAAEIIGRYLFDTTQSKLLLKLARSKLLWDQRIAVLATLYFIKKNSFDEILTLSKMLLNHKHDLMHKAIGWMLREMGKKDISKLRNFLNENYKQMPRTMLRYSIEKLAEDERQMYLKGEV